MEVFKVIGVRHADKAPKIQAVTAGLAASVLRALLYSVSTYRIELFHQVRENLTLEQLAVLGRNHPGIFGVCFEYAIHHAINSEMSPLYDYVRGAMRMRLGWEFPIRSVLAGIEKKSFGHLIEQHETLLGEGAKLVLPTGEVEITSDLLRALRSHREREKLPKICRFLQQADLLVGSLEEKVWTTVSLKTNPQNHFPSDAITLMIYPFEKDPVRNENDAVLHAIRWTMLDRTLLLPIPTNGSLMKHLHVVHHVVVDMVRDDIKKPKHRDFPESRRYSLAQFLYEHRKKKVSDLIEMLVDIAKPVGLHEVIMPNPPNLVTDPAEIRAYQPEEIGSDVSFTSMPDYLPSPVLDDLFLEKKAA